MINQYAWVWLLVLVAVYITAHVAVARLPIFDRFTTIPKKTLVKIVFIIAFVSIYSVVHLFGFLR